MGRFAYKGRNGQGGAVEGVQDGESPAAVARLLSARGVTPIAIHPVAEEKRAEGSLGSIRLGRAKPSADDLMFFCRQMHTLTRSGVPLIRGIAGLAESTRNARLAEGLRQVIRDLEGGYSLSHAFNQHPDLFSPLIVGILQVGENTGRVDESFRQLAFYLERERDTRTRMKTAMRYPVMVLVAIGVAMAVINLFVIPAFAKVFAGFNAELPWATRILLTSSRFTVDFWPFVFGGIALVIWGWLRYIRTEAGQLWWDRHKLRLPVVGPILMKSTLGRFARSFGMMLKAGVPLVQGLSLLTAAVDNAYVGSLLVDMRRAIERGDSIGHTAAALGLFPALVLQMIEVGEETGRLDEMLVEVADYYDAEVDLDLKNLSTAIEPILLLIVGVMVLILALGVFLPIWDLGKVAIRR